MRAEHVQLRSRETWDEPDHVRFASPPRPDGAYDRREQRGPLCLAQRALVAQVVRVNPVSESRRKIIARIIDIARDCAVERRRFPSSTEVAGYIAYKSSNSIASLLKEACDLGLIKVDRPHPYFLVISAPDGSWSTLGYDAWKSQQRPKSRKCMQCRTLFSPLSRYIFRCERCKNLDGWEMLHV